MESRFSQQFKASSEKYGLAGSLFLCIKCLAEAAEGAGGTPVGPVKCNHRTMGNGMNKVLPGFYVGNFRDSKDEKQLEENGITHILSVHDNAKPLRQDKVYLCISASDCPGQDLICHFPESFDFIHAARLEGGNVLVHCLAGVSRSVTIAVAYVMTVTNLTWREALEAVRQVRTCANPNFGFRNQLKEYETTMLNNERKRLREKFSECPHDDKKHCSELLVDCKSRIFHIGYTDDVVIPPRGHLTVHSKTEKHDDGASTSTEHGAEKSYISMAHLKLSQNFQSGDISKGAANAEEIGTKKQTQSSEKMGSHAETVRSHAGRDNAEAEVENVGENGTEVDKENCVDIPVKTGEKDVVEVSEVGVGLKKVIQDDRKPSELTRVQKEQFVPTKVSSSGSKNTSDTFTTRNGAICSQGESEPTLHSPTEKQNSNQHVVKCTENELNGITYVSHN